MEVIPLAGKTVTGVFRPFPRITVSSGQESVDALADARPNSFWVSGGSITPRSEFLIVDLGVPRNIDGVRMLSGPRISASIDLSTIFPRTFRLQASDDPNTWPDSSTVLEVSNHQPSPEQWETFSFPSVLRRFV